ncbi:MAG TPA: hypothetical protein P5205_18810 [Candidatus Paceibacterota bacterium]|nr:hypothetical protein [Verrucomicrobiota bacterium]HSA12414.1 hypothetical protein [Candidatus Paceibacterota bacterium]
MAVVVMAFGTGRSNWLKRGEWLVCIGATLAAVGLHLVYLTHAGGLWRDETSSVNLATMPTIGQMWGALDVPVLFPAMIRIWCALGLGGGDISLRLFGFLVGVAILGASWLNARVMGLRIPFIALGLLTTNITLLRWGDSLRAYGPGSLLMLLTLGQIWALINQPNRQRFLLASLLAVLSVHCLYQNAILLAAACGAAGVVCLLRKKPRTAGLAMAVGLVAAVSLLPYASHFTQFSNAYKVLRTGFNAQIVWSSLSSGIGSPLLWERWIWLGLLVMVGALGIASLDHGSRTRRVTAADLTLFGAAATGIAVFGFFLFLGLAQLPTQPWYYLPLLTFVAMCMDAALAQWLARRPAWGVTFVGLILCISLPAAFGQAKQRQTNVDLIAGWLHTQAKPNDLIAVYPWFNGITFNRYYKGDTPWTTIPTLADFRVHRYDLVKERLAAQAPIQPVLDRIAQTRASGNRIWIVGELPASQPGETSAPTLPPAPDGPYGWSDVPYNYVWGRQVRAFITAHGGRMEKVSTGSSEEVSIYEKLVLTVVR